MKQTDRYARDQAQCALLGVAYQARSNAAYTPIGEAITRLLWTYRRRDILAALDHRVTWSAVADWRSGRRSAPQWARERIAAFIRTTADEQARKIETSPQHIPLSFGEIGTRTLRAWRARQKEKAAPQDGPPTGAESGD